MQDDECMTLTAKMVARLKQQVAIAMLTLYDKLYSPLGCYGAFLLSRFNSYKSSVNAINRATLA